MSTSPPPPPPPANRFSAIRQLRLFRADPLATLQSMVPEDGCLRSFRLGTERVVLVARAEDVEAVLVDKARAFERGRFVARLVGPLFGDATSMLDGEVWARHRQQTTPAYSGERLATYLSETAEVCEELVEEWATSPSIDVETEGMRLWMRALGRILCGRDICDEAERILRPVRGALDGAGTALKLGIPLPLWLPFRHLRAIRRGRNEIRLLGERLLLEHRASGAASARLADRLACSTGDPAGRRRARDDLAGNIVIGGHQMMTAFTWTLSCLSARPELQDAIRRELACAPPGAATDGDLLTGTIRESLRLYPPFYLIPRTAARPVELGGFRIPRGALVVTSPWLTQRMPLYFPEPESFCPERWSRSAPAKPRFSFFPFGGGSRACVAARIIPPLLAVAVAAVVRQHRIVRRDSGPLHPVAGLTLSIARAPTIRIQRITPNGHEDRETRGSRAQLKPQA